MLTKSKIKTIYPNKTLFMDYRDYFDNIYSPEMLEPTRTSMVQALKEKLIPYIENNESITRQEISNLEIAPEVSSEDYLSIKACQNDVSVCLKKPSSAQTFTTRPIEYRVFNATGGVKTNWTDLVWDEYDKTGTTATNANYGQLITPATLLTINSGEVIQYRNKNIQTMGQFNAGTSWYSRFYITGLVESYGNVMSLCDKSCLQSVATDYTFINLFNGVTGLTTPPKLPATIVCQGCYQNMFYGCTNLKYCPELPARNVAYCSYNSMFRNCTTISATSKIMAVNGDNGNVNSYTCQNMFYGCTKLKEIYINFYHVRPAKDTTGWVTSVPTATTWGGKFHKRAECTTTTTGATWIPKNWTIINDMVD